MFEQTRILRLAFPLRLRCLRARAGLTQRELAVIAGVSVATICALESGLARDLKLETLHRLCNALNTSPDDLLGFHMRARLPEPQSVDCCDCRLNPWCPEAKLGALAPEAEITVKVDVAGVFTTVPAKKRGAAG